MSSPSAAGAHLEPVVLVEVVGEAPPPSLLDLRATALRVLSPAPAPGHCAVLLVELGLPADALARQARTLPGTLAVAPALAAEARPADGARWRHLTARCPSCGPVEYWVAID